MVPKYVWLQFKFLLPTYLYTIYLKTSFVSKNTWWLYNNIISIWHCKCMRHHMSFILWTFFYSFLFMYSLEKVTAKSNNIFFVQNNIFCYSCLLGSFFWKIISILQSLNVKNWIHPCYIFLVFVYILLTCTLWLMILVLVSCPADTFWNRL